MEKTRTKIVALTLMMLVVASYAWIKSLQTKPLAWYEVGPCSQGEKGPWEHLVSYDELEKTLTVRVWVNCCSDEVLVEREGSNYTIYEKDYDGLICRCMCPREVRIFNVTEPYKLTFVDKDGVVSVLSK
ncbi:MAG TPA: hypothetical protein ENF51_01585 [Candidatus Aenigmarchaeota archaeon]|nr:hypothetical protein [Candidatus Aenigmarchaeota archaeon]